MTSYRHLELNLPPSQTTGGEASNKTAEARVSVGPGPLWKSLISFVLEMDVFCLSGKDGPFVPISQQSGDSGVTLLSKRCFFGIPFRSL